MIDFAIQIISLPQPVYIFSVFYVVIVLLIRYLLKAYYLITLERAYFEIVPPAYSSFSDQPIQKIFSSLQILLKPSLLEKLIGSHASVTCEVKATKLDGIVYLITVPTQYEAICRRLLLSYIPELLIIKRTSKECNLSINQSMHKSILSLPIPKNMQTIEEDDTTLQKMRGMMTSLHDDERIVYTIEISYAGNKKSQVASLLHVPVYLVLDIVKTVLCDVMFGTQKMRTKTIVNKENVGDLVNQQFLSVTRSIMCMTLSKKEGKLRKKGLQSVVQIGNTSYPVRIVSVITSLLGINEYLFVKRISSLIPKSSDVISLERVATLFHFPYSTEPPIEDTVSSYSPLLPAPVSIKNRKNADVYIGNNTYANSETPIGLREEERLRHMYIIGATGSGKTTLLTHMIRQDIASGKGLCVIDPHGDMADAIIASMPKNRLQKVIVINPEDIAYPIGLNLLEKTEGLTQDERLLENERITEAVVSLFRKVFSDMGNQNAFRIEYLLRNACHTALCLPSPTLFTIFDLLTNQNFRTQAIKKLTDPYLLQFWRKEFNNAGEYQRVKMNSPVTARIGRFLFSPSARRMLEQYKSTINFDEIINTGNIVVCRLPKGTLGEDTTSVLGVLILTKIQLASLRRTIVPTSDRKPFYVYIDEYQNFSTPSFIQMISESRKYGVGLVMAQQTTSQQYDKNYTNITLANVGTVITFRTANPEDAKVILPQFAPLVTKEALTYLPTFRFYCRISAVSSAQPFSGETIKQHNVQNAENMKLVISHSRLTNARKYEFAPYVHKNRHQRPKTELVSTNEREQQFVGKSSPGG